MPDMSESSQVDWIHHAALAAYRAINPDGPAFSALTQQERNRWRDAYGVARAIEPTVLTVATQLELNETSFEFVKGLLGHPPPESLTIHAGQYCRFAAHKLVRDLGCGFVELPGEALKTKYTWIVRSLDGAVWSAPTD